eukprot:comp12972_c0_seq1/m.17452 comp12972_c0_seq1/g.17452  ORF comp12972_c0_seq1/g.17452 comp12972_c0_seq1/m.17452 type:complete len:231 (+) comp12972_c0_seq1:114-806(+)
MAANPVRAVKIVFYVMNLLLLLVSCTFIFVSVYAITVRNVSMLILSYLDYIVLAIGIVVAFVAVLGCAAAKRETKRLIWVYFGVSILMLMVSIAIIVLGVKYNSSIPARLDDGWKIASTATREKVQKAFVCCGWENVFDTPSAACANPNVKPCGPKLRHDGKLGATIVWVCGMVWALFELAAAAMVLVVLRCIQIRRFQGNRGYNADIPLTKAPASTIHHGSVKEDEWKV